MSIPAATFRIEDLPSLQGDNLERFLRQLDKFCSDTSGFARGVSGAVAYRTVTVKTADFFQGATQVGYFLRADTTPRSVTVAQALDLGTDGKSRIPAAMTNPAWRADVKDGVKGVTIWCLGLFNGPSGGFDPTHQYQITFRLEA